MKLNDIVDAAKKYGMSLGLGGIRRLLSELGDPQTGQRIVHVAGTNGKGSICLLLLAALDAVGVKACGFVSPDVYAYEDKWRYGKDCEDKALLEEIFTEIEEASERMVAKGFDHPTLFEMETAAAFMISKKRKAGFLVLEAGMGGRDDATNIITEAAVSVFSVIGLDHTKFLGDTLEEIARNKAAIIKPKTPVISAAQSVSVKKILEIEARKKGCDIFFADITGDADSYDPDEMNQKVVGMVIEQLFDHKKPERDDGKNILFLGGGAGALARETADRLSLPGRFERICENPDIIMDGGHNPQAGHVLCGRIERSYRDFRKIFVVGMFKDKDNDGFLRELARLDGDLICVSTVGERALPGDELAKCAEGIRMRIYQERGGVEGAGADGRGFKSINVCDTIKSAMGFARSLDDGNTVVIVCGSFSILRDAALAVGVDVKTKRK